MPGDKVEILGVRIDRLTRQEMLDRVSRAVADRRRYKVMYANIHVMNIAYGRPELRRILNGADLVYCDGAGVKLGAKLLGHSLPERMTGADWIFNLCRICQETGHRLYFLGGKQGVAAAATRRLEELFPGLAVVGTHHGYFADDQAVIAAINAAQPDILLVGFGTPLQEMWIDRNFARLDVPVVWAVGALLDFVAGVQPRAPRWMLNHGLEWLYRLLVEPRRLFVRYIIGNPLFIGRVLAQRFGLLPVDCITQER